MILLTTTLLTVQTNDDTTATETTTTSESFGPIGGDKRNILTYERLIKTEEESASNADVAKPTNQENESWIRSGKQATLERTNSNLNWDNDGDDKTNIDTINDDNKTSKNDSDSDKTNSTQKRRTLDENTTEIKTETKPAANNNGSLGDNKQSKTSDNMTNLDGNSKIDSTNNQTTNKKRNMVKANLSRDEKEESQKRQFGPLEEHVFEEEEHLEEEEHIYEEDFDDEITIEVSDSNNFKGNFLKIEEKDLDVAIEFGMKEVEDLIDVKEPMLYKMGFVLDKNDPASKVAAFGKPNDMALKLSKFGFLTLEASKKIAEKSFPKNVSRRQSAGFPGAFESRLLRDECPLRGFPRCPSASNRYRTSDGTCNNPDLPWRGSAMLPMQRFLPPMYEDGIQSVRRSVFGTRLPSARLVSSRIHRESNYEIPTVTLMFMQWGQFIDHDITSVVKSRSFNGSVPRCCDRGGRDVLPPEFTHPSCLPIEIPEDDWFFGKFGIRCMEFIRSAPSTRINCDLGWREQINQVTPYIDASTIYGSDMETSDSIRLFRKGKIIYGRPQEGPLRPPDPPGGELCRSGALTTDCFQSGDGRVSEQPGLTAFHTIWVRFHNKVATVLGNHNFHWSDEKLFQETRKIIYSIIQHITYKEFLPIVLGPEVLDLFELNLLKSGYYNKYDSRVNPALANSFSAAAYRFGHSMVQNSFVRADHRHRPLFNNVSLHEERENFENIWSFGSLDRLILGFSNQPAQRRDEFICDELSNHLFQASGARFGMDLGAINIQRGRDHGLPPYTSWRQPCGLSSIKDWRDLEKIFNFDTLQRFRLVYQHVDDIDLFSGGLAEKPVRGGVVGPTFACIIAQQFSNLRKGDRFWYENGGFDSSFTPAQLQQIRHVTFAQVLCQTMTEIETIQSFVFLSSDNFRNARTPCDDSFFKSFDLSPWIERSLDEVDNKIDFNFKRRQLDFGRRFRNKREAKSSKNNKPTTSKPNSALRPTRKTKKRKTSTTLSSKPKADNRQSSTEKSENKYAESNSIVVNSIPARPTYSTYGQKPQNYYGNDPSDVTYLVGVAPTKSSYLNKPSEKPPIEVNIKIQYFLSTTEKPLQFSPTQKRKKRPTVRPYTSYSSPRPSTYRPVKPESYDTVVITPNNFLNDKPPSRPISRPSKPSQASTYNSDDDINRPTYIYNRPTADDDVYNVFRPTYNNNEQTSTYNKPFDSDNQLNNAYKKPSHSYSRPSDSYSKPIDSYKRPSDSYNGHSDKYSGQSDNYNRPVDGYSKPIDSYKRPSDSYNGHSDGYSGHSDSYNRPDDSYSKPSVSYSELSDSYSQPTDVYNSPSGSDSAYSFHSYSTTKKPYIIRPASYYENSNHDPYDQTLYDDKPFSTSKRPNVYRPSNNHYIYTDVYSTNRPNYRPSNNNYDNETPTYVYSRPVGQSDYHRDDPIAEVYSQLLNGQDKIHDLPQRPSFGQLDPTTKRTTLGTVNDNNLGKPTKIYTLGHVQKQEHPGDISDKLDFKTRLVTKSRGTSTDDDDDDKIYIKISSVKADATINNNNADIPTVKRREGDLDLSGLDSITKDKETIRIVDIDVVPSEVKNSHWKFNHPIKDPIPLLTIPDVNANYSCSQELPKPMQNVSLQSGD